MAGRSTRVRLVVAVLAALAILAPLAWLWQSSLVAKSYSVMGMGYLDYGGGPVGGHDHGAQARSISDLVVDPARKADVRVDLVAEQQNLNIGGRTVPGYTINGTSPGPTITAHQGQLIEVHLRNASVKAGIALHWHGVDVPAAMDGVAGVTQDEVPIGGGVHLSLCGPSDWDVLVSLTPDLQRAGGRWTLWNACGAAQEGSDGAR